MVGKTLPYLAISLVATAMILVAARVLFGVEIRGSYLHLLVAVLLYLFGALGFGLFISTLADTQALAFQAGLHHVDAAGDPALGLHLPDPDHAGAAAAHHLPGARALLPRDPARHHPEGRGPRHLLAAGRGARDLRPRRRRAQLGARSRGGRPEVRVLWRVIVKEFLQLKQDHKMIPVIFVAPVVQVLVFGFAVNTDVTHVPTVLVDQDQTRRQPRPRRALHALVATSSSSATRRARTTSTAGW